MGALVYRRVLLKLSGEALGEDGRGLDPRVLERLAAEIHGLISAGGQVGLVIGGGNLFRGANLAAAGMGRVTGDRMGMLGTVMNALAMADFLSRAGAPAGVMSAFPVGTFTTPFDSPRAVEWLEQGRVAIFSGGTGNPFFTTDSAAALRAVEIGADLLIKATKVDGVYSADPLTHPDAEFYPHLSYDRALREGLGVMDAAALVLCRDHDLPLRVTDINQPGGLLRLLRGEALGSLVDRGREQ